MVELIVGIIIENVGLLSKMEDMKVKEIHIQVSDANWKNVSA